MRKTRVHFLRGAGASRPRGAEPRVAPIFLTPRNRAAFADRTVDDRRGTEDALIHGRRTIATSMEEEI
jgi:hypothetical protein